MSYFTHNVYINSARKLYSNVYLFELHLSPLATQKHNREIEQIVKECILDTVRSNIPIENILQVYLDESMEEDVQVEVKEEIISDEPIEESEDTESVNEGNSDNANKRIEVSGFEDEHMKMALNEEMAALKAPENIRFNMKEDVNESEPPQPSLSSAQDDDDNDNDDDDDDDYDDDDDDEDESLKPIKIGEKVNLSDLDVHSLNPQPKKLNTYDVLDEMGVEELS